ncbi:MAG: HEAT repeat domain-containing protein [candidate division Zixibacteria bacterium]|nr:HEAT repeat domain-containing protein [candidate division Zixibacteria bacterium]
MSQPIAANKRINEIKLILKDMLKVIKVVAMYPEGNPLPQSLRRSFAEKLAAIIDEHGEIKLQIDSDRLYLEKEIVFTDSSKEESLAGLFFGNGVTSLTFAYPPEVLDIYTMLDVIKAYQNKAGHGADLASLLWEANLSAIKFTTVEDISLAAYEGDFRVQEIQLTGKDGREESGSGYDAIFTEDPSDAGTDSGGVIVELPDDVTEEEVRQLRKLAAQSASSGGGPMESGTIDGRQLVQRLRKSRKTNGAFYLIDPIEATEQADPSDRSLDSSTLKVAEAAQAMGYGDLTKAPLRAPDTALILNDEFKLTEEEELEIRGMLEEDAQFDMYASTLELMKELLLQESELSAFFETVTICDKLIAEYVSTGRLIEAGRLLTHLRQMEEELAESRPLWSERLRDSRIAAGNSTRMKQFAEALNKYPHLAAHDIRSYLDLFGWESLSAITNMLGDLEHRIHRELLCDFLSARGKDNIGIIAKGVTDRRWFVVRNSVGILARMNDDKAIGYLAPALRHEDKRVRMEVLTAVKDRTDARVMEILKRALLDKDAEIRRAAITQMSENHIKGAFEAISAMISDATFPTLSFEEQVDAFKAYSIIGGENAVPFLKKLATRLNLFNDELISMHRKAAFIALAHNISPEAEALLLKIRSSWMPTFRGCAREAIALRREVMLRRPAPTAAEQETPEVADVR